MSNLVSAPGLVARPRPWRPSVVRLVDAASGKEAGRVSLAGALWPACIAFSPDGRALATLSEDPASAEDRRAALEVAAGLPDSLAACLEVTRREVLPPDCTREQARAALGRLTAA